MNRADDQIQYAAGVHQRRRMDLVDAAWRAGYRACLHDLAASADEELAADIQRAIDRRAMPDVFACGPNDIDETCGGAA